VIRIRSIGTRSPVLNRVAQWSSERALGPQNENKHPSGSIGRPHPVATGQPQPPHMQGQFSAIIRRLDEFWRIGLSHKFQRQTRAGPVSTRMTPDYNHPDFNPQAPPCQIESTSHIGSASSIACTMPEVCGAESSANSTGHSLRRTQSERPRPTGWSVGRPPNLR